MSHDPFVGNDTAPRLLQERDMRRMRLAVGCVPAPTRSQPPKRVGAGPVAVPFRRDSDRLEGDLVGHDPARFQPACHAFVDAWQIVNELKHSLRDDEVYCGIINHSHRPWGAIRDEAFVTRARRWIGCGGPDHV